MLALALTLQARVVEPGEGALQGGVVTAGRAVCSCDHATEFGILMAEMLFDPDTYREEARRTHTSRPRAIGST